MSEEKYAGADWIKGCVKDVSPFGEKVADLLGQVFRGIYHLSDYGITKCDWANKRYIEVKYYGSLATYDNNLLTDLVIRCHDECIRLDIKPVNFQYVKLVFSAPYNRDGTWHERHPTIEDAIVKVRATEQTP